MEEVGERNACSEGDIRHEDAWARASVICGTISCVTWVLPLIGVFPPLVGMALACVSSAGLREGRARRGLLLSVVGMVLTLLNGILGVVIC